MTRPEKQWGFHCSHSPVVKHGNGNPVCIPDQIWNTECSLADEMCAQWKVLTEEISIPSGKAMFLMLATSFTPEVRIAPKGLLDHNLSATSFFECENELYRFGCFWYLDGHMCHTYQNSWPLNGMISDGVIQTRNHNGCWGFLYHPVPSCRATQQVPQKWYRPIPIWMNFPRCQCLVVRRGGGSSSGAYIATWLEKVPACREIHRIATGNPLVQQVQ